MGIIPRSAAFACFGTLTLVDVVFFPLFSFRFFEEVCNLSCPKVFVRFGNTQLMVA